ncbi:MAG: hypothetical protein ACT4O4_08805, partial [Nitrospiraceae bacterium]
MSIGRSLIQSILIVLLVGGAEPGKGIAASPAPDHATIIAHDLAVELFPASHELVARDHVELELPRHATSVAFTLAPTLHVDSITLRARPEESLPFTREPAGPFPAYRIAVALPAGHEGRVSLMWSYRGVIDDPPREPRHLRFVTPSETAGHIGPEGVYLSSESQWYPDIDGSLSVYRVLAHVPEG